MKKMYRFIQKAALLAFIGVLPLALFGQNENKKSSYTPMEAPHWYIGVQGGVSQLYGDISKYRVMPDKDNWNFGFGGLFGRQFTPFFGLRGTLAYGDYSGQEDRADHSYLPYYDLKVEGSYIDYSLQMTFDLDRLIFGYNPDRKFGVYGLAGIGNTHYRVRQYRLSTGELLGTRGLNTENGGGDGKGFDNRCLVGMIPAGLGINYSISERFDLTLESVFRFTDSEAMDLYEGGAEEIKNDFYNTTTLGLVYKFGQASNLNKMQKDFDKVKFETTPAVLETRGDSIDVTIRGTFPPEYFNKKAAFCFQPVLKYATGETKLKCLVLRGENVQGDAPVISYKNGGTFTYKTTIAYSPEMNVSELVVSPVAFIPEGPVGKTTKCEDCTKAKKSLVLGERKLADGVIHTCKRIAATPKSLTVPHGYVRDIVVTREAKIYYPKNLYSVNFNFGLNKDEASKKAWSGLYDHIKAGYKIKDISINGWASPEGEETFNENLSGNRAEAAKKVLNTDFDKMRKDKKAPVAVPTDITITTQGNGPDWNGFMKLVEASDLKEKGTILNIVNMADPKKKEQEIRNMILIYPQLEKDFLPPLRRAEIVITAIEPSKTDAEILSLATTEPEKLTDKELLYAATLTQDLKTQQKIYRSATQLYPNNWKAFNNAGVIEMKLGNINEAGADFEKANNLAPDQAEVVNNLGAIAMVKGDNQKAKQLFEKAKKLGANENYNLGVLMIPEGKYSEAVASMRGEKCDYNLALALMLSGNNGEANKALECAEKNAQVYYLTAVLGARTGNTTMMVDNLQMAIQADSKLKQEAKNDREFIKYADTPEFKKLVE
jgi:tetratricopeptide (TPR) repeat protein